MIKKAVFVAAVCVFGVVAGPVSPATEHDGVAQAEEPEVLLGDELAQSLGLTPITDNVVTGCMYFAEAAEGRGYCLDSVVSNEYDAWMLGRRITGHVPTALEEQMFNLQMQIEALPDEPEYEAQFAELAAQYMELVQQAAAQASPAP